MPGLAEEIVDAVLGQRAEECLGGDCWPPSARRRRHALFPWVVRPPVLVARSGHSRPRKTPLLAQVAAYPTGRGDNGCRPVMRWALSFWALAATVMSNT